MSLQTVIKLFTRVLDFESARLRRVHFFGSIGYVNTVASVVAYMKISLYTIVDLEDTVRSTADILQCTNTVQHYCYLEEEQTSKTKGTILRDTESFSTLEKTVHTTTFTT